MDSEILYLSQEPGGNTVLSFNDRPTKKIWQGPVKVLRTHPAPRTYFLARRQKIRKDLRKFSVGAAANKTCYPLAKCTSSRSKTEGFGEAFAKEK